ncbi:Exonuclease SbcD [Actinokineospora spheciospongiae]|uniref:Nuclease SbcCD subunit D n=1 Tax=Actinokineospora spheciospongiae TaxID=909613 RepID=W7IVQ8_9PSEU|nr:exonuclease SbcCD subunit D [Actinokineospora spheciospongiae]EWC64448.1 Exonuclease SbcD [Actinokineospora spheciospongiae]PWW60226.1 exodeoxyribonuclease I subunit D [Actinokineospora spheciospongiae]
MSARVLHTSDWHLGRQIGRHRRDREFDAVLGEIVSVAQDFAPDLIVHSGDLFDSPRPSLDDMRRAAQTLRELGDIAPVVVVAGNHDTRHVLAFLDYMLSDLGARTGDRARVRFATDARPGGLLLAEYPAETGELTVRVGALPYLHPNRFAYEFDDPASATASYAERMREVQAEVYRRLAASRGPRDLLVYAAHLFVEGATPSYSERTISVSSAYAVEAVALPEVDYGALGHIHKPQLVPRAGYPAHYAGSPLQMDFGETRDAKSIALVEITPGRPPRVELAPLDSGRPLRRLTGTLDQIAQRAAGVGDAWVKAVVDSESPMALLGERLEELLPQATIVDVEERCPGAVTAVLDRVAVDTDLPDVHDMLHDYLSKHGTHGIALDQAMSTFAGMRAEPDPADTTPCCEEELLDAAIAGKGFDGIDRTGLLTDGTVTGTEARR